MNSLEILLASLFYIWLVVLGLASPLKSMRKSPKATTNATHNKQNYIKRKLKRLPESHRDQLFSKPKSYKL